MRISFHGAAGTVTGSNHLVETEGGTFLIDCGMFQGPREIRTRNYIEFSYDPAAIDAVIITHAHIDHSGLLPKLVKNGFNGPVYVTHATAELLEILLYDSAHIQSHDTKWENRRRKRRGLPGIEPLYEKEDVKKTLSLLKEIPYHETVDVLSNVRVTFRDAGHIMGSSFLTLDIEENGCRKRLVASGDIGRSHQAIISDPEVGEKADMVIMESTYGDRSHKKLADTNKEIIAVLKEVIDSKGTMIIPAFAVGRTQEMVYRFFELSQQHELPPVKIYVDSPMASKVTEIYAENRDLYDEKTLEYVQKGMDPLRQKAFHFVSSVGESKQLDEMDGPKVIISASGMCDAGRILHHLKHHIWKENTHVLFVGYQARGTLGRRLIEGAKRINILGENLQVRAKLHTVGGLSAHADADEMIAWLNFYKASKPHVFVVHGDADTSVVFAERIGQELGMATHIPDWHDYADITFQQEGVAIEMHRHELETGFQGQFKRWQDLTNNVQNLLEKLVSGVPERHQVIGEALLEKLNDDLESAYEELQADDRK